jgi:transcriptional antiterminator RfaH
MSVQWYVVRSKANKEMILWRELTAQGFECFYPRLYVRPVNPRSRKVRSLFQWMPFSIGCIAFDGVPATVPDNLVQAIRRHVDQINEAGSPSGRLAGLKKGELVTIDGGPFDGYEAIFDVRLPGSGVELPEVQIQPRRKLRGK